MATPSMEKEIVPDELRTFCPWHAIFSLSVFEFMMYDAAGMLGGPVAYCTTSCWSRAIDEAIQELTSIIHWLFGRAT